MAIWSDINGFPEAGFPILSDVSDRMCLGTLYTQPLKASGFMVDINGAVRFGAITGASTLAIAGAFSGATTGSFSGLVTLSSDASPITMTGANAVLSMTGINASIGTNLSRIRRGFFKDLEITNTPTVLGDPVALTADLARYVPYTGALLDVNLGSKALTTTGLGTFGSLVVDTTTLVVNAAGYTDKVGIGTATPGVALDIVGDVRSDNFETVPGTQSIFIYDTTRAGIATGVTNIVIGYSAGSALTTGFSNVFLGASSGRVCTDGQYNMGVGGNTFVALTSGISNTAIGYNALAKVTDGDDNTAIGTSALSNVVTTTGNVAIGSAALAANAGYNNVAIGFYAGRVLTGNYGYNVLIGERAGEDIIGSYNTFIGAEAGEGGAGSSGCEYNVGLGMRAGEALTTGDSNIFLGAFSGDKQSTNSNLLIIDNQTRADVATELTNSIIYGVMAAAPANQSLNFNANVEMTQDTFWTGDGSGVPYGSCYGDHIGWAQAAAVQNTWYEISDADMADGELNLVTHDGNGKLTVTKAGRYSIDYSLTYETTVANDHIETAISVSGTENAAGKAHNEAVTPNVEHSLASGAILDLAASATIEISIRTTDAGTPNLSVQDLNIKLTMVGGT